MKITYKLLFLFIVISASAILDSGILNASVGKFKCRLVDSKISKSSVNEKICLHSKYANAISYKKYETPKCNMNTSLHQDRNNYTDDVLIKADTSIVFDKKHLCDGSYTREIRPYDFQFYPRNSFNQAEVLFSGQIAGRKNFRIKVIVKEYDFNSHPISCITATRYYIVSADINGHFNYKIAIESKMADFSFYYSLTDGIWEKIATNVVCGDTYLISGQSNGSADIDTAFEESINRDFSYKNPDSIGYFCRTFRRLKGINDKDFKFDWGYSIVKDKPIPLYEFPCYGVGVWGLKLQHDLVKANNIPICVINDAVGGSGMYQHAILKDKPFLFSIYPFEHLMGSMLSRLYLAGLQNNIKAIIWSNGEHEVYSEASFNQEFIPLYEACNKYLTGYERMYICQISSYIYKEAVIKRISEEQRVIGHSFNGIEVMTENGLGSKFTKSPIHFTAESYLELGRRFFNLIDNEFYQTIKNPYILPPDIVCANLRQDTVALIFNQLLDPDKSDNLDSIKAEIQFNEDFKHIPINSIRIEKNQLILTINQEYVSDLHSVSYAGFLPQSNYNSKCYLRNSFDVAAYSFTMVTLETHNYCNPDSVLINNQKTISSSTDKVKIFPNPVDNELLVVIYDDTGESQIDIFNSFGERIYRYKTSHLRISIDSSMFKPGNYIVKVKHNEIEYSKIIIIAH